jgi:hypothetical protein
MGYGAGAAGFPPRNRAALALTFGVHVLVLLAWMQYRAAPSPELREVVSILLRPPTPGMAVAEPPRPAYPAPRKPPPPALDRLGGVSPASAKAEQAAAAAGPATPASVPAPAITSLDDARAPMTVQDAIREQKEADGGIAVGIAKRQAGRIDRELRNGKSGIPDEPDTPIGRLRRALEAAHIDRSKSVYQDSYTSPDGTVIYRKRIGKGAICRRGGNVSPLGMKSMAMGGEVGEDIPCPRGVDWKSD